MKSAPDKDFKPNGESHLKHLRCKGLQPETIDAYASAIRRIGGYFDHRIDDLSEQQLADYCTLYSLGLCLGEGLRVQPGDIDTAPGRVQIRNSEGNKDRFMSLRAATLAVLCRYWPTYRNPVLLFSSRHGGTKAAARATAPFDRGGPCRTWRSKLRQGGEVRARLQVPGAGRARLPLAQEHRSARTPHSITAWPIGCAHTASCACSLYVEWQLREGWQRAAVRR